MKQKHITAYMNTAKIWAECSTATKLKVGAVVVKDHQILSTGYNGTPNGWDNDCEDKIWDTGAGGWLDPNELEAKYPYEEYNPDADRVVRYALKTKPEVLHAEMNALMKLAKSTESGNGADLFITHAPCLDCAKGIFQAGIARVWFGTAYRDTVGIDFLKKSNIQVTQHDSSKI
jgi:dCMP deaminase